jgi:glutamine amidotransferase
MPAFAFAFVLRPRPRRDRTPITRPHCHPFACGRWLFMHNGSIGGWSRLRRQVEALIPDELYPARIGTTDSEAIFLAIMGRDRESSHRDGKDIGASHGFRESE